VGVVVVGDVAQMVAISLTGATDERIVNVAADAPITIGELVAIAGSEIPASDDPLDHPWSGHLDVSVARAVGFRATVPTVYDAQRDGIL
jgi:hypothetical protein